MLEWALHVAEGVPKSLSGYLSTFRLRGVQYFNLLGDWAMMVLVVALTFRDCEFHSPSRVFYAGGTVGELIVSRRDEQHDVVIPLRVGRAFPLSYFLGVLVSDQGQREQTMAQESRMLNKCTNSNWRPSEPRSVRCSGSGFTTSENELLTKI